MRTSKDVREWQKLRRKKGLCIQCGMKSPEKQRCENCALKCRLYYEQWAEKHKTKRKKYQREWYLANKGYHKEWYRKNRAKKCKTISKEKS